MRCASVASMKRLLKNKKRKPPRETPRAGTKIGRLYDLLKANKGEGVPVTGVRSQTHVMLNQLRDFYGCDIRLTKGTRMYGNRVPEYTLVGEWFGKVYVDYIAEKMEKS